MFNFKELDAKYKTDAAFNKGVNMFRNLLEQYGFLPSELREMAFIAQYTYEMSRVETVIKTEKEWDQIREMRELLKVKFSNEVSLNGN